MLVISLSRILFPAFYNIFVVLCFSENFFESWLILKFYLWINKFLIFERLSEIVVLDVDSAWSKCFIVLFSISNSCSFTFKPFYVENSSSKPSRRLIHTIKCSLPLKMWQILLWRFRVIPHFGHKAVHSESVFSN